MTKRYVLIVVGAVAGALLLYQLFQDYLHCASTGVSLGWLALEVLLFAAWLASMWLASRGQPQVDLEAITGAHAVACAGVLIAMFISALAVGMYLDQYFGPHLSFAILFASGIPVWGRWVITALSARLRPVQVSSAGVGSASDGSAASSPPN